MQCRLSFQHCRTAWPTQARLFVRFGITLATILLACILPAHAAKDGAAPSQATKTDKSVQAAKTSKPENTKKKTAKSGKTKKPAMTMDQFLDRLMIAESGGNDTAKNPLSTATGSFQFIESTFIYVMRRHFPERVVELNRAQILKLRTDRKISRDAARAFTKDNATRLVSAGHKSTFPHLRLAFLMGPGGAITVLNAKPETPLPRLFGPGVIRANPWMARLTASGLVARSAREVSLSRHTTAGVKPRRDPVTGKLVLPKTVRRRPRIRVRCNLARPSCRRWLALKRKQLARKSASKKRRRVAASKR